MLHRCCVSDRSEGGASTSRKTRTRFVAVAAPLLRSLLRLVVPVVVGRDRSVPGACQCCRRAGRPEVAGGWCGFRFSLLQLLSSLAFVLVSVVSPCRVVALFCMPYLFLSREQRRGVALLFSFPLFIGKIKVFPRLPSRCPFTSQ